MIPAGLSNEKAYRRNALSHLPETAFFHGDAKAVNLDPVAGTNKAAIGLCSKVTKEGMTSWEIITGEYKG